MNNLKQRQRGFTLIELMIVVVIAGVVMAIAIPSYVNSTRKAHRADAEQALVQLAQFMERNYTVVGRYDLDSSGAAISLPFSNSPLQGTTFYTLTVTTTTPVPATGYTLTATPTSNNKDVCGTLTLNNLGAKTPATGCW